MITKKRIAITGGRGRLASLAASFFREAGYEVVLFSRVAGEGLQSLEMLLDPAVMGSFGALLHCAWSTVPFTSEADPGQEAREDLPLLKKLLKTLINAAEEGKIPKFIFLSSASVYGNQTNQPATEIMSPAPLGAYARGKIDAEEILRQVAKDHPLLEIVILRITNVIGFSSNPERPQGILPKIIETAKRQQTLEVWGDGHCSKDYLWIDDFLLALEASLLPAVQGVFNIGSGENFSILDFISIVEQTLCTPLVVTHRDRYPWDVSHSVIDSSAFSKMTGWKPQANILEEIKKLMA